MLIKHKQCPLMTSKLNKTEAENYIRSNRVWSHTSTSSWDSSLVICRLLGFTGLVLACLVKSPRSKSVASRSLTAVSHSHLSDLTVHQQAGSHNRQQSKREVTYQNILSEQHLLWYFLIPLKPPLPFSAFIFSILSFFFIALAQRVKRNVTVNWCGRLMLSYLY